MSTDAGSISKKAEVVEDTNPAEEIKTTVAPEPRTKKEAAKKTDPAEPANAPKEQEDAEAAEQTGIVDAIHTNQQGPFAEGEIHYPLSAPPDDEPPDNGNAPDDEQSFHLYEWFEEHFNGNIGYTYPLRGRSFTGTAFGDEDDGDPTSPSPTLSATLTYVPAPSYFARLSYFHYLDPSAQRPWHPDFAYSFGYDNWRPNTFSFSYSNFGANRLSPDDDEEFTDFWAGGLSLGYKFSVDDPLAALIDGNRNLGCNTSLGMAPIGGPVKTTISFSCRYGIWKGLYINGGAKFYPVKDQQQPWDPDYVYGFGYSGLGHKDVSIAYNNYAAKRWPWRQQPESSGGFLDGSVSLSYKLPF